MSQQPQEAGAPQGAAFEDLRGLLAHEQQLVAERRRVAGEGDPAITDWLPRTGIALSGGGIRSATFCLGLLRGLAQNGLLKRFDYLSTVSGGGFVGAMLGRLIGRLGMGAAESALAGGSNLLLWWLRSNGRYLTPSGSRDLGMALVTYFRAWFAVQLEFAVVALLIGLAVIAPHAVQDTWHLLDWEQWPAGGSPWWPFAFWWIAVTVPGPMAAYWIVRDPPMHMPGQAAGEDAARRLRAWPQYAVPLAVGTASVLLLALSSERPGTLPLPSWAWLVGTGLAAAVAHTVVTWLTLPPLRSAARALEAARVRNRLTRQLRAGFAIGFALLGVGALDVGSWEALRWVVSSAQDRAVLLGGLAGFGGAVLLAMRVFAERLQKLGQAAEGRDWSSLGPRILNLAGTLASLFLLFLWLVLLQALVFRNPFEAFSGQPAWLLAVGVAVLALAWTFLTGWLEDAANASSLHSFYRARLTRAYLSVGNGERGLRPGVPATPTGMERTRSVTEVVEGDDQLLRNYRPHASGGPIHLINTCLNQSRDDRSGLYNADRKGTMLTVSAHAFEVGPHRVRATPADYDPGTLGRWTAISGAAVATGAGSYTSRGWAAMLFLLGVRLGYWIRAPWREAGAVERLLERWLPKQHMLGAEATATFHGMARPWWYLSDGGHFENTGVYALLRRELDFILLADCGADAKFEFGDLENLVRKARIDFDADIEFYTQDEAAQLLVGAPLGLVSVVAPEQLLADPSSRGVLLARITYRRSDPTYRKAGTLLVVKPNLHNALDVDVLGYARANPDFPQQSTGNQFFDEAQWESYHRLGEDFGRALAAPWLAALPGWASSALRSNGVVAPLRAVRPAAAAAVNGPAWRRTAQAAAVGTTLGLGALGTIALAAWQTVEQVRKARDDERAQAIGVVGKASEELGKLGTARPSIETMERFFQVREKLPRSDPLRTQIEDLVAATNRRCEAPPQPAPEHLLPFCEAWSLRMEGRKRSDGALAYWTPPVATVQQVAHAAEGQPPPPAPAPAASGAVSAPAPAPVPAAPAPQAGQVAPAAPAAPSPASCQGVRLYTQVYDEPSRAVASELLSGWADLRMKLPGIENVTATAAAAGNRKPEPWRMPTLVVHNPAQAACAQLLVTRLDQALAARHYKPAQARPLPTGLVPTSRVIELWLPPVPAAAN